MVVAADFRTVGERIRTARERAGLTQAELGAQVGVKQQSVQKWEAGKGITLTRLDAIAEVLKITTPALLGHPNRFPSTRPPDPVKPRYGPDQPDEDLDDELELSASGVDLEELRRLDPDAYAVVQRQAELLLDRARERSQ